jgi:predicted phosphodiesterase
MAAWSRTLPATDLVEVGDVRVYLLHDVQALALDPAKEGIGVVVAGHSHKPGQSRRRGVLYFNPGSAGPRRFRLPIAVGRLFIRGREVEAEVVTLEP